MAYAGICLTDDLQPHSDPYFSQRSQQEISTYVASNQLAINEVQTVSLRRFGGGNEVQVATFGPGFADASTIAPLTLTINAAPSATSRGGAMEVGNTVTIATAASALAPAGRHRDDLRRRHAGLQRDVHGHGGPDDHGRSSTSTP